MIVFDKIQVITDINKTLSKIHKTRSERNSSGYGILQEQKLLGLLKAIELFAAKKNQITLSYHEIAVIHGLC